MVLIFPNFVNFDRFDENQYLRNFTFRVHLQNLIPARKFFLIHLRKLIIDQSFKFIFNGTYHQVFFNNKKQCMFAKIYLRNWGNLFGEFLVFFSKFFPNPFKSPVFLGLKISSYSQIITKTAPIKTRIVMTYAMK